MKHFAEFAFTMAIAAGSLPAQCNPFWDPGFGGAESVAVARLWDPDGPGPATPKLVVAGNFPAIGGIPAQDLACFDPATGTWSDFGTAFSTPAAGVGAVLPMPNGDLIVGGAFSSIGGVAAQNVARWDGSSWSPLGSGVNGAVGALHRMRNGDLIVAGTLTGAGTVSSMLAARWDGTTWSAMPGLSVGHVGAIFSLAGLANGDVVASGLFHAGSGGNIARWDGSTWTALTTTSATAYRLATTPDGELVRIYTAVERWDGTQWSPLTSGLNSPIRALEFLPDGDLLAVGGFLWGGSWPNLVALDHVARWNGTDWASVDGGLPTEMWCAARLPNGDVFVGGDQTFRRLRTPCPASVTSQGAGCVGTGGLNELKATSLPWAGATFAAEATGMPTQALVLSVYGFAQLSLPMASVLPSLPGCTIQMTPDLTEVRLPASGVVTTSVAIPPVASLAGQSFHHYVVPFELNPLLQITQVTSSNALTATIGAF